MHDMHDKSTTFNDSERSTAIKVWNGLTYLFKSRPVPDPPLVAYKQGEYNGLGF